MGCVAPSQAHRVMGGEAEKRLQKNQEHGGENWRVWNNTYWERTWKKNWKCWRSIHSCRSLSSFAVGDINTGQDSPCHQEDFLHHFASVHPPLAACFASSEQVAVSQSPFCPFYINDLERRPHWTAPSLRFLRSFAFFQQHCAQFVIFSEAFWVLNWEGRVQKRKGLKTTQEKIWGLSFP